MNYFATPISSEQSLENYIKTVVKGIEQDDIKSFEYLTGSSDILFKRFKTKNNKLHLWGIKKDKYSRWNKVNTGDILFFYRKKNIVSWCRVLDKFEDTDIATILWGTFESLHYPRYTWPLIILLDKPNPCNIPFSKFNKILGYQENYFLRSFFKLNDKLKNNITKTYGDFEKFILSESE